MIPMFSLIFGQSAETLVPHAALPILDEARRDYSLAEAYGYCERLASARHRDLPAATRYLSNRRCRHMLAIYAFACAADDFADDQRYYGKRKAALDQWEDKLTRAFHGEADHPIFVALRDTVDRLEIPITPFINLLTSFRMSLVQNRYPTFADLRLFSEYKAQPIGQLLLYLYRYRKSSLQVVSDELCIGLHIISMLLQDLHRQPARDRVCIPIEDFHHFGVAEAGFFHRPNESSSPKHSSAARYLIRFQVVRARGYLERGRPLLDLVGRTLAVELALIWHTGQLMLDQIERSNTGIARVRPALRAGERAKALTGASQATIQPRARR